MAHDDRRKTSPSKFSLEPVEPRMMLAFGGQVVMEAIHFHVAAPEFITAASFSAPARMEFQSQQGNGVQMARQNTRMEFEQAVIQALSEFAPMRRFAFAPPRITIIIFNPQMPTEPPQMIENPPPIESTGGSSSSGSAHVPTPGVATVVPPPTMTTASVQTVVRASNDVVQLLNTTQTTAARLATRTTTLANTAATTARGTWSIGSMLYTSLAPDGQMAHFFVPTQSETGSVAQAVQAHVQSLGQMMVDAASNILQSPHKMAEIARMGSPLAFIGDSLANFIEESASIPAAIVHSHSTQTAWLVTFTVLATDAALLAYHYRRMRKLRSLARVNSTYVPLDHGTGEGHEYPLF